MWYGFMFCSGFIELLTRIAQYGRLSNIKAVSVPQLVAAQEHNESPYSQPVPYVSTLLRLMDASGGKNKLIHSSRKSVAIRKFVYTPSPPSLPHSLKHTIK